MKRIKSPSSYIKFMKKHFGPKNFEGIKGQAIIDQLRSEYNEYFDQAVEDIKKKKKKSPLINSFQTYLNKQKEKIGETKLNGPGASKEWNKLTDVEKEEFKNTGKVESLEIKFKEEERKKRKKKKNKKEPKKKEK